MQQRVKKVIQKLATKYNLSEREAEHAVKVYYEKIREVLGEGNYPEEHTFKIMLIPFFGKFIPNQRKIRHANFCLIRKKHNNDNSNEHNI